MFRPVKSVFVFLILVLMVAVGFTQKYNISTKKLSNGLEVIVIENHAVPLVTVEIDVKNGAYTESPEYDGLSHLYEHMFFKANKKIHGKAQGIGRFLEWYNKR